MSRSDRPSHDDSLIVKLKDLEDLSVDKRIEVVAKGQVTNHREVMKKFSRIERLFITVVLLLLVPAIAAIIQAGMLMERIDRTGGDVRDLRGRVDAIAEKVRP